MYIIYIYIYITVYMCVRFILDNGVYAYTHIYIYIYIYIYISEVGGVRAPAHPNREIVFVFVCACVRSGGRANE